VNHRERRKDKESFFISTTAEMLTVIEIGSNH